MAKYDLNGSYVWHIPIGDGNYDHPLDLAVDDSSNVAVTGWFQQTSDFDPGPGTALLTSPAGHSGFVAKFNNAGEYQWAFGLGDNGGTIGMALTFGREGEIYATGEMSYTADFDPSSETFSVAANGSADFGFREALLPGSRHSASAPAAWGPGQVSETLRQGQASGHAAPRQAQGKDHLARLQ